MGKRPDITPLEAKALLDAAGCVVVMLAPDGTIVEFNREAEEVYRARREQVIGKNYFDLFLPENERARIVEEVARVLERGERIVLDKQIRAGDGSLPFLIWNARRVAGEEGGASGLLAVGVDITTERERGQVDMRHESERFEHFLQATPDAVIFIDREARVVHMNLAAEAVFGYSREELEGQRVNVLMPKPFAVEHDEYIRRFEQTGEARIVGTTRVLEAVRKSGEIFPMELSVLRIGGEDARGARYGAFIRDISEQQRLRGDLAEKSRLASVGTVAAALAHELGNPLNNMKLHVQILERRLRELGFHDERIRNGLSVISGEVGRLAGLLEEFRLLSRRQHLDVSDTDLSELIDRVCAEHKPLLDAGNVRVEQDLSPDLPRLKADAGKIRQVLLNVCKNAVEAMRDGGVLTLRARVSGEYIVVEVADTGTGIPEGRDVFEPFLTTKDAGTGLGLAIVKRVVDAHGGRVSHEARSGAGTTFRIELPLAGPVRTTLSLA